MEELVRRAQNGDSDVIILKYFEDISVEDIAVTMDKLVGTRLKLILRSPQRIYIIVTK